MNYLIFTSLIILILLVIVYVVTYNPRDTFFPHIFLSCDEFSGVKTLLSGDLELDIEYKDTGNVTEVNIWTSEFKSNFTSLLKVSRYAKINAKKLKLSDG